jgi:hypothetical protein
MTGKLAYQDLTLARLQHEGVSTSVRQYVSTPLCGMAAVCQYVSTSVRHYAVWLQYVSTSVCHYAVWLQSVCQPSGPAMLPKLHKPQHTPVA